MEWREDWTQTVWKFSFVWPFSTNISQTQFFGHLVKTFLGRNSFHFLITSMTVQCSQLSKFWKVSRFTTPQTNCQDLFRKDDNVSGWQTENGSRAEQDVRSGKMRLKFVDSVWPDRSIFEMTLWKLFVKRSQMYGWPFGLKWKHHFKVKTATYGGATFGKFWATFYFNKIRSHCLSSPFRRSSSSSSSDSSRNWFKKVFSSLLSAAANSTQGPFYKLDANDVDDDVDDSQLFPFQMGRIHEGLAKR